jgi:hypothetical protein
LYTAINHKNKQSKETVLKVMDKNGRALNEQFSYGL